MVRLTARLAGLTLATLLATAVTAHASTHVFVGIHVGVPVAVAPVPPPPPPPAVVAGPPVPYGYVWRPGYYVWNGYGYQFVRGAYERRPYAGAAWVAPRWAPAGRGAYYARGYWRRRY